jgi:hypothetical protein
MTEEPDNLSCAAFQAQLPELIGSGVPLEAARNLFPIEEPPDKLWKQIEAAIKSQKNCSDPC